MADNTAIDGEIRLEDIRTPADFAKENPHLVDGKGKPKLSYLLRNREVNGLTACGAVIEPVERRPMIVVPKMLDWFLTCTRKHGIRRRRSA